MALPPMGTAGIQGGSGGGADDFNLVGDPITSLAYSMHRHDRTFLPAEFVVGRQAREDRHSDAPKRGRSRRSEIVGSQTGRVPWRVNPQEKICCQMVVPNTKSTAAGQTYRIKKPQRALAGRR